MNLNTDLTGYKSNIVVETLAKIGRFTKAYFLIESNFKIEPAQPPNPDPYP
jgi:hypothetical protein